MGEGLGVRVSMSYLEELFSLTGKTAVVTGASRGLGPAIFIPT